LDSLGACKRAHVRGPILGLSGSLWTLWAFLHTKRGTLIVVSRPQIKARDELRTEDGSDLVIIARTDVLRASGLNFTVWHEHHTVYGSLLPLPLVCGCIEEQGETGDMAECRRRCEAFVNLGADVVYAEGLETEEVRCCDLLVILFSHLSANRAYPGVGNAGYAFSLAVHTGSDNARTGVGPATCFCRALAH
jgi:hypothetical protein